MSLKRQIIAILLLYVYSFFSIRWFLWGVKEYPLNNSAAKKRKKGQTFKEWFLYSRYREEIPKLLLILYFAIVVIHPFALALCIIFDCSHLALLHRFGTDIVKSLIVFLSVWEMAIHILFWQKDAGYAYDRWIPKKRGMRKRKKR